MAKHFLTLYVAFFGYIFNIFGQSSLNFSVIKTSGNTLTTCYTPNSTYSIIPNTSNSFSCVWSSTSATLSGNPVTVTQSDFYSVKLTDLVTLSEVTKSISIFNNQQPPVTTNATLNTLCPIDIDMTYTFLISPNLGWPCTSCTYTWNNYNGGIATPTNQYNVIVTKVGSYTCVVTDTVTGCTSKAVVDVLCNVGIEEVENSHSAINIFPNPFTDGIFISGITTFLKNEVNFTLRNAFGQTVIQKFGIKQNQYISLLHLTSGIYFVEISSFKNSITKKIIKE